MMHFISREGYWRRCCRVPRFSRLQSLSQCVSIGTPCSISKIFIFREKRERIRKPLAIKSSGLNIVYNCYEVQESESHSFPRLTYDNRRGSIGRHAVVLKLSVFVFVSRGKRPVRAEDLNRKI